MFVCGRGSLKVPDRSVASSARCVSESQGTLKGSRTWAEFIFFFLFFKHLLQSRLRTAACQTGKKEKGPFNSWKARAVFCESPEKKNAE